MLHDDVFTRPGATGRSVTPPSVTRRVLREDALHVDVLHESSREKPLNSALQKEQQLRQAMFRGASLHLENADYLRAVSAFTAELLATDVGGGDLTAKALRLAARPTTAQVLAKTAGIAAGIAEFSWLLKQGGLRVDARKQDGDAFACGETLLDIEGSRADLLLYERVGLNLLQRLSGIATMTHNLQQRIRSIHPGTFILGTRKTPWGLLDKRALHLGGGGTHRLGLWDAILVKNNHLALLADREEDAVCIAAQRAWECRGAAAFVEIEVRSEASAIAAAKAFRSLRDADRHPETESQDESRHQTVRQTKAAEAASRQETPCPCVLMLDNIAPREAAHILGALRAQNLLDDVLIEASGNISESNLQGYAEAGVDAISVGALTHSVQALDLSQRLS